MFWNSIEIEKKDISQNYFQFAHHEKITVLNSKSNVVFFLHQSKFHARSENIKKKKLWKQN